MRTFFALLLLTNSILAAPRVLSPERPVGDPKPGPNVYTEFAIDIASGGEHAVAAWSDHRIGEWGAIVVTRLNDAGESLDQDGIIVGAGPEARMHRIIWDGNRYLVAWSSNAKLWISTLNHDVRPIADSPQPFAADFIARPNGGTLLTSVSYGTLVLRAIDDQFHVTKETLLDRHAGACRFVRSGNTILAVWTEINLERTTVMAQRIDADGAPSGLPAQLATLNVTNLTLASSSDLLAYGDGTTVYVLRAQPNGALNPLATYPARMLISITRTADGGFIASEWPPAPEATKLRRFDASGNFVDELSLGTFYIPALTTTPNGITMAAAFGSSPVSYVYGARRSKTISMVSSVQTAPRLASDGTNLLVVWREHLNGLFAQLVAPSGDPLHDRVNLGYALSDAAVSFDGTSYVVARAVLYSDHSEVQVQRIARDGSLAGDPITVGQSTGKITNVVIAGKTVAWLDDARFPLPRIVWTTLDLGVALEGSTSRQIALATDGSKTLLASATQQYTLTVSEPGGFETTIPTAISPDVVAIGGSGDRWLVAYADDSQLYGQFLDREGTPIGEPVLIGNENDIASPRVAWDGEEFIVTWEAGHRVELAAVGAHGVDHLIFPMSFYPEANGDALFAKGAAFLAYQHPSPEATNSARVFTRTVTRARVRPSAP